MNKKIALAAILAIAITVSFLPHFSYPFPLHVDEWFHIAVGKQIAANNFLPPQLEVFTGIETFTSQELGWHYLLAIFVFLFNPDIFAWQFLTLLMAVLAVLSVYFFAKRWGEKTALIAAFLTALLPSNVTIGGLSFLVPINLSLIIIPIALHFLFDTELKQKKNFLTLCGLNFFLLLAHPPSAVILLLVELFYSLLLIKEKKQKTFLIWSAGSIALLLSIWNYLPALTQKGIEALSFPFWYYLSEIPFVYGIIPTIFFVIGFYLFFKEGKKEELAIICIATFLIADIVFFSNTGIGIIVPYQRAFIPLMLFMGIIAANALAKIKNWKILGIILFAILAMAAYSHITTQYYHVIEQKDYEAFEWIKENTPKDAIAVLDPWKARAFVPIAERKVFTVTPFGPIPEQLEKNSEAVSFLENKCTDTNFMEQNSITVAYAENGCENPALEEKIENVYIVR